MSVDRLWRLRLRWEAQGQGRWASRHLNDLPPGWGDNPHTHTSLWSTYLRRFTMRIRHSRTQINTDNIQTQEYTRMEKSSYFDACLHWTRAENEDVCFDTCPIILNILGNDVNWTWTCVAHMSINVSASALKHQCFRAYRLTTNSSNPYKTNKQASKT